MFEWIGHTMFLILLFLGSLPSSSALCLLHFSKTISKTLPIRTNNFTKMILELEIVSDFMLEEKVVFCYK